MENTTVNKEYQFEIGDTVQVDINIREGKSARIQSFTGNVIAKKSSGISKTFTVRRLAFGYGVEKIFPLYSPNIANIKVLRKGKVRRAKLYYLRDKIGKATKIKEKK